MMKKYLVHFVVLFLFFTNHNAFAQQDNFTSIKAFLPHWNGAEISLFRNNQLFYKGLVEKDMFSFTGNVGAASPGSLKVKAGKIIFYTPVFLEPGIIKVRDAGGKILISYGTPSNDIYFQLNKSFDSLAAQQKNLNFPEAINFKREQAATFIKNNSSSIVSVQLLKDYYYLAIDANDTVYYSLVHSLDSSFKELFYVKEMMNEANNRYLTALGKPAPYLQVKNINGRLSSVYEKGHYSLIDFWASWCLPCRKENAALKKLYKKYVSAGFNITSVSLDANKMLWLNAIKQDKLEWQQLNDLKGWDSPVARMYGIKVIPMNYLINREGVIIGKNLHTEQIDIMLANLLAN